MAKSNGATKQTGESIDPFATVLGIEPRFPVAVMIAVALLLHAGAAAAAGTAMMLADMATWAHKVRSSIAAQLTQTYEIEMAKEKPPEPPPPEPAKEEPKEEPAPVIKQQQQEAKPHENTPPPPPAAAQAGKVLTQEPPKDEPVDLTGNTFVTGSSSTFAGGTTQAGGTSKTAVYGTAAAATGVPGGKGTAPAHTPGVDKSRAAGLLGGASWDDCPFPSEADAEQIDNAYVTIQVKVKSDGAADSVTVVQDPGHGFGREAKKCAMRKQYATALDADGNAMAGTTKVFRVRFSR
ncbi:MAG: hypothetical protein FWD69_00955 [Polyangiaceae bacterium]|nr:hypothetical protein [Polyangiaceae bacterium]